MSVIVSSLRSAYSVRSILCGRGGFSFLGPRSLFDGILVVATGRGSAEGLEDMVESKE